MADNTSSPLLSSLHGVVFLFPVAPGFHGILAWTHPFTSALFGTKQPILLVSECSEQLTPVHSLSSVPSKHNLSMPLRNCRIL